MIQRLRRRFIRIAMLSVSMVLLFLCLVLNGANYYSAVQRQRQLLDMVTSNRGSMPERIQDGHPGKFGELSPETPFSTRYFVLLYTEDGDLVKADLGNITAVTADDTAQYIQAALRHGVGYGSYNRYQFSVVQDENGCYMAVFLDSHEQLHSVFVTACLSVCAMAGCCLLVYIFVIVFSRKAIDPVVQASIRQKQFITDASHELKTPITVVTTCLKVLEMDVGEQKWILKAQTQMEKLTELVNSLVSLSRMDEENRPQKQQLFSVSAAVSEVADSFLDYAEASGHPLNISVTPELQYLGDEFSVRQLVSLLLDNAVKYASPGSSISLSLQKVRRGILLISENDCTPLEPGETEKLFGRFYRADKSRSGSASGFGLGLSMAQSIVEAHHGRIRAECPTPTHIRFLAELK